MNYQDTIKYDENKRSYVDAFGYVVSSTASKHLIPIENEEVTETYPNIATLQGGDTGVGPKLSADFSRDTNVDIFIEPKGTGVLKSTADIVSNTNLENQVRLSTNNANLGIINTEGADTNIDLDLRTKGSLGSAFIKFNGDQSSYVSIGKGQATIRGNPTDLNLQSLGSGSKVRIANNSNNGGLEIVTDTPTNTGVTLQASSNQSTCNLIIKPKSGSYVSIPAPLYTTYGYMLLTRSGVAGNFAMNVGSATEIQLDSILLNTFGSGYWSGDNKSFVNASSVAMKLIVSGRAMPSATIANNSCYFDTSFKIYNSSNALLYTAGRQNFHPDTSQATFFSLSPTACIYLNPGDYFRWQVYVVNTGFNIVGDGGSDKIELNICQVP